MFLKKFEPKNKKMAEQTDLNEARQKFLVKKNYVCWRLVKSRYDWMNEYIRDSDKVIYEIGSGLGFSKEFIHNSNLQTTDVLENPWIDRHLDAMNMGEIEDGSVDVFVCCNVIHHFFSPYKFLTEAHRKLVRGGESSFLNRTQAFF